MDLVEDTSMDLGDEANTNPIGSEDESLKVTEVTEPPTLVFFNSGSSTVNPRTTYLKHRFSSDRSWPRQL
ncbi:11859_t:CDS:2 [Dentiscutata heterogama]|uniref:11859_t:CDS:1 n=1 Tax=Dentiscutata heterogama TaxID=1316150 RepID=A0ACA9KRR5_9GLOM|nr:11859_t:CDS:2 [Dentiscutata heterogama]